MDGDGSDRTVSRPRYTSDHCPVHLDNRAWSGVVQAKERAGKKKGGGEIRDGEYGGKFIPATEFEENWIVGGGRGKSGSMGYKYKDSPGCYVILIFNHEIKSEEWDTYDDVYIGQSVNICKRVHAHFNGKGNGDVYADVRNGKHVYVQFKPCVKDQMNDLEKSLIAAFHATNSYNSTRGGSASR